MFQHFFLTKRSLIEIKKRRSLIVTKCDDIETLEDFVKCLFLSQEHTFCYNENSYNSRKLHVNV